MSAIMKPRRRAGTYDTFVRRYEPIPHPADDNEMRPWDDKDILAAFDRGRDLGHRYVWTVVDGDTGFRMYLVPGFATVNYIGRVLCKNPWPDEEERLPGYVW